MPLISLSFIDVCDKILQSLFTVCVRAALEGRAIGRGGPVLAAAVFRVLAGQQLGAAFLKWALHWDSECFLKIINNSNFYKGDLNIKGWL